jgi:hypothetical protein
MTPAEEALYAAEAAKPGAAVELALEGQRLHLHSHRELDLKDEPDDAAVIVLPSPGSWLYADLMPVKHKADAVAPLKLKLPPDVALIVVRPAARAFAIRQDGVKSIRFEHRESTAPARPKPSPQLSALSYLANSQRSATP